MRFNSAVTLILLYCYRHTAPGTHCQCCAQFWPLPDYYHPSIGRFRVGCGRGVRIRQSYSDFNERGNHLAGGRKLTQHRTTTVCSMNALSLTWAWKKYAPHAQCKLCVCVCVCVCVWTCIGIMSVCERSLTEPDFTKCDMFLDQHLCWP